MYYLPEKRRKRRAKVTYKDAVLALIALLIIIEAFSVFKAYLYDNSVYKYVHGDSGYYTTFDLITHQRGGYYDD